MKSPDPAGAKTARQALDPVCKMIVNVDTAPAKIEHGEHAHYFCSTKCKEEFEKDPKKYH
jgi:YHS domain-containing protein